jgi:uncharacterized protein YdbL (DUF1318 family)
MIEARPMMRHLFLALSLGAVMAAGTVQAQSAATKDTVVAAKSAGQVGEQADGYLGLVGASAPAGVKAAVAEINAGRALAYKDIAAKSGVTEQAAGEATARQLFARVPPGGYYKPLDGSWTRK